MAKYFPKLSISDKTYNRWMSNPFEHMLPTDLELLTHEECNKLREYLSTRKKKTISSVILGASVDSRAVAEQAQQPQASTPALVDEENIENMDFSRSGMYIPFEHTNHNCPFFLTNGVPFFFNFRESARDA